MNVNTIIRDGFFVLCIVMAGCKEESSLPFYNTAGLTPLWNIDTVKQIHTIPAFSFTNQRGRTITSKDLDNKIYVANFFFTSCGAVCRKMTINLQLVQQAFEGNDSVAMLSHTVTPWIDSVPVLQKYSERYGMSGNWHLLTGDKHTIYNLARRDYFAEEEPGFSKDSSEFLHTERVLLVDRHKRIRGIYNGTLPLEIGRLIEDMRILLRENE